MSVESKVHILRPRLQLAAGPEQKPKTVLRSIADRVGNGANYVLNGTANTALDGAKWVLKKTFSKMLDVTAWVAKGAIVASLAATVLTAAGAAVSPQVTLKVVDSIAQTLGANPRAAGAVKTVGEVVIIQSKYTGELLGLAIKNAIELGAQSTVYTAQAIHSYIVKPFFVGFAGVAADQAGRAWSAVTRLFTFR